MMEVSNVVTLPSDGQIIPRIQVAYSEFIFGLCKWQVRHSLVAIDREFLLNGIFIAEPIYTIFF